MKLVLHTRNTHVDNDQSIHQASDLGSAMIPRIVILCCLIDWICEKWNCINFDKIMSKVKKFWGWESKFGISLNSKSNVWTKIFVLNLLNLDFQCPKTLSKLIFWMQFTLWCTYDAHAHVMYMWYPCDTSAVVDTTFVDIYVDTKNIPTCRYNIQHIDKRTMKKQNVNNHVRSCNELHN